MWVKKGVSKPQRRTRSWRPRTALAIVPLTLLGTLVLSAPAYALALNGNEAPSIQKLSMYPPNQVVMNIPTEYDVTPGPASSAVETSIPDQVVNSITTQTTSYTTEQIETSSGGSGNSASVTPPPTLGCGGLGCDSQSAPYQAPNSGKVYPSGSGPCTGIGNLACLQPPASFPQKQAVPASTSGTQSSSPQYTTIQVAHVTTIVTTVTNSGIHITNAKLLSVAPILLGVNATGSNLDGVNIQGAPCTTSASLVSPLSPQFPDYSLQPWLYSTYFSNLGICNINPGWLDGGSPFSAWLSRTDSVQFDLRPEWQLTAGFNTVTTANGAVTNSVPGSVTLPVAAPLYIGPTLPAKAITAVPCAITDGVTTCPNGS